MIKLLLTFVVIFAVIGVVILILSKLGLLDMSKLFASSARRDPPDDSEDFPYRKNKYLLSNAERKQ